MSEWGSVQGDERAKALVEARRASSLTYSWSSTIFGAAALAAGIWYGFTAGSWALGATILLTGMSVAGKVVSEAHDMQTHVTSNGVRLRPIESRLEQVDDDVKDIRRTLLRLVP